MSGPKIGIGLGFNQGSGFTYDPLAQAFFDTLGITDPTIKSALNFRVRTYKGLDLSYNPTGINYLAKIKTDHPVVGGTAALDKYNLIDTSLHAFTYSGGLTHNANGITGNGTNGAVTLNISPSALGKDTAGAAIYLRNSEAQNNAAFGVYTSSSILFELYPAYTDGHCYSGVNSGEGNILNSDGSGHFLITRQSSTIYNLWVRGVKTAINKSSGSPSALNVTLLAYNTGTLSSFSTHNFSAFKTFNASLTDAEAAVDYAMEQQFQTLLGRNV